MIQDYLSTFDFNLALDDAAADPSLELVRRRLASAAAAEGLDAGYYEAQELAEVFLDAAHEINAEIMDEDSPARTRMREILDRSTAYQDELFELVCALPLAAGAAHLCWLADIMKHRADMFLPVSEARGQ